MKRAVNAGLTMLLVLFVTLPLLPLAIWSFSGRWLFPSLWPTEFSLRAWRYVLSPAAGVGPALVNSLGVGLAVTALSLVIGIPAGRALGLYRFRGKVLVEFLMLAPTIVPTLAVAMGIHIVFIRYGLADTHLGVILVHLIPVTPYMVLILAGSFAGYDIAYEQQARTLGAQPWQVLLFVTLPIIAPGVIVAALYAFLISWSQYILTLLIGGGNVSTLPLQLFAAATNSDHAVTSALSILFTLPTLVFLGITARYLGGRASAPGGFGRV